MARLVRNPMAQGGAMPARATREGPDTLLSAILPVPQRELPRSPPKLPHTMKEVGLPAGDCCEQRKVLEGAEGDTNRRGGGGARGVKRSGSQCGTVCSLWLRDDACLGGLLERNPAVGSLRALLAARLPVGARRLRWRLRVRACVRAWWRGVVRAWSPSAAVGAGKRGWGESASDSHSAACG